MTVYMIFIVTSLLCAAAAAVIARRTNRDPLRWAIGGVALNCLAVLAVLLSEKKRQGRERRLT